jgi:hypothetical protein
VLPTLIAEQEICEMLGRQVVLRTCDDTQALKDRLVQAGIDLDGPYVGDSGDGVRDQTNFGIPGLDELEGLSNRFGLHQLRLEDFPEAGLL